VSHRCASGEHCADAAYTTVTVCTADCDCHLGPHYACSTPGGCGSAHIEHTGPTGAPIEVQRGLCAACVTRVTRDITELGADFDALRRAQYDGASVSFGEVVAATRELPVPISLTLEALAAQIAAEVTAVVEPVAEALAIDWDAKTVPTRRSRYGLGPVFRDEVVFSKAIYLVSTAVPVLLALGDTTFLLWRDGALVDVDADGVTMALGLAALHRAARGMLGVTRAVISMPTPCPRCETATLVRPAGCETITCTSCGCTWTEPDYETLTLVVAHVCADRPLRPGWTRDLATALHRSADGTVARPIAHPDDQVVLPYDVPMVYQPLA
jgi:hypothetical protein